MNQAVELFPNSMSFRFVATIDAHSSDSIPEGFTGRARITSGGRLDAIIWFTGGDMDDPEPGTPAYVKFRVSGKPKQIRHYRQGRLHDPAPRQPAVEGYFADGSIKYREHYRYGRRHDAGDVPAITKWRNDGSVRTTHHYYEGMRIEIVRDGDASERPEPSVFGRLAAEQADRVGQHVDDGIDLLDRSLG